MQECKQKILVVATSGKLGTGKDFLIDHLLKPFISDEPSVKITLADHFKIEVIAKDGVAREKVYGDKDDVTRQMLQKRGTEEGRNKYGEDIWIKILHQVILNFVERGIRIFYISDVRFKNEVRYIQDVLGGIVIRVVAPLRNRARLEKEAEKVVSAGGDKEGFIAKIASHLSETDLDDYPFENVVNNDPQSNVIPHLFCIATKARQQLTRNNIVFLDAKLIPFYKDAIQKNTLLTINKDSPEKIKIDLEKDAEIIILSSLDRLETVRVMYENGLSGKPIHWRASGSSVDTSALKLIYPSNRYVFLIPGINDELQLRLQC